MAKKETITMVNTGVCVIIIEGQRRMPGDEFEISADAIKNSGVVYAVARGDLSVKDNSKLNSEITEGHQKKRRKDPAEGKTKAELEDGGEL